MGIKKSEFVAKTQFLVTNPIKNTKLKKKTRKKFPILEFDKIWWFPNWQKSRVLRRGEYIWTNPRKNKIKDENKKTGLQSCSWTKTGGLGEKREEESRR